MLFADEFSGEGCFFSFDAGYGARVWEIDSVGVGNPGSPAAYPAVGVIDDAMMRGFPQERKSAVVYLFLKRCLEGYSR
ncbi:hypothetical protein [Saccharopolyspora hattusasensis]|uniref:hypothetical protein n=1 Tax=Saccharopolyspora hattusasensis TaxID=1128679 RepID=UPI003D98DAAB